MGELCRRCPLHDGGGAYGPARETVYADPLGDPGFEVAVAAGSPRRLDRFGGKSADRSLELDWQDALVGLATAVVERGGRLTVPANAPVVHMLALATFPHAVPHGAEAARVVARVRAVETGGPSEACRRVVAPLVHRNALTYHEIDGALIPAEEFEPPGEHDGGYLLEQEQEHHPLTAPWAADALGVVVIYPDERMLDEMDRLRAWGIDRLVVVGGTGLHDDLDRWAAAHDPTVRLLDGLVDPDDLRGAVPYDVVMELVVDRWLESAGLGPPRR